MAFRYEVIVMNSMPLVVTERSIFASKAEADAFAHEKAADGHLTRITALPDEARVYSLAVYRIRRNLDGVAH